MWRSLPRVAVRSVGTMPVAPRAVVSLAAAPVAAVSAVRSFGSLGLGLSRSSFFTAPPPPHHQIRRKAPSSSPLSTTSLPLVTPSSSLARGAALAWLGSVRSFATRSSSLSRPPTPTGARHLANPPASSSSSSSSFIGRRHFAADVSSTLASLSALPSDESPQLFDASHLLSGLHEDKLRLRCLEVDDSGNCRHVEFSRSELSSMLELHPRDLRFLDSSMRNLPSILARRRVIIVNLEMFKALITADRVLMFDPWYPHVQSVVQPMQASVLSGGELFEGKPVPFEFIALEHILLTVCRNLEDRFDLYIQSLEPLLSASAGNDVDQASNGSSGAPHGSVLSSVGPSFTSLVADGSGSTLMHLLQLKNGLTSFEVTLRETVGAMRDLLETDEDMAGMYLSAKKSGQVVAASEHGEVEVILETYLRKVDELENEVEQNVKSITLTEEHIQIRLDSNRNSMMKLELLSSISTLGVTTAALGAALFGMNLPSHLENSPWAFWSAAGIFLVLAGVVVRQGLRLCSRRGIHLLHIEAKEPPLHFPHTMHHTAMAHYAQQTPAGATWDGAGGQAMGIAISKLNKQRRLAKLQGTAPAPLPNISRTK